MNAPVSNVNGTQLSTLRVTIDGQPIEVAAGTTILEAARRLGIDIPILCHRDDLRGVGVCRVCAVEVKGARTMAAACVRPVENNMEVSTHHTSAKVNRSVATLLELLITDNLVARRPDHKFGENELETLARRFGVTGRLNAKVAGAATRFPAPTTNRGQDFSSPIIAVDHNACILCDRCIRACNDLKANHVMGRMGKGYQSRIAFDLDQLMGESSCVACGECMVVCPTGALAHKGFVKPEVLEGQVDPKRVRPATAEELAAHPLFQGVSAQFLKWNEGAVVRRSYKAGEVICREGEYGRTAFYIEEGEVEIFLATQMGRVANRPRKGKLLGLFPTLSFGGRLETAPRLGSGDHDPDRFIHIDAPVSLETCHPVATLEKGELFGEQAVLTNQPRSATARARTDVVVLEMLRNVVYMLRRNKAYRELIDSKFVKRTLANFVQSLPMFMDLTRNNEQTAFLVGYLLPRVELVRLDPGAVIFRQGDQAEDFYMVARGFVKVAQRTAAGERILNYLGKGSFFGEIGLLAGFEEVRELAPNGVRTATCSALDHVDLIKISHDHFRTIVRKFSNVRRFLLDTAVERLKEQAEHLSRLESRPLAAFLEQGLMEAQSLLVLDLEKCTRCDECTKACSDSHEGVTRLIREGLRFDRFLVASSCRSCLDPTCLPACPVDAINRNGKSLEIRIKDHCIGCGKCAENCPYGNINMVELEPPRRKRDAELTATEEVVLPRRSFETEEADPTGRRVARGPLKATTCDLCSSYDGIPSCVYACPHDAAHRMKGQELLDLVAAARRV